MSDSILKEFRVTLETVTPLFLGGAEARGKQGSAAPLPELRVPSLRGGMRYWYRTLLGGVLGDKREMLNEIHKRESHIFGGATDEKKNIGGSAIALQISNSSVNERESAGFQKEKGSLGGGNYLYWSMEKTKIDGTPVTERRYLKSNRQFELIMRFRPPFDEEIIGQSMASLWLLTHLGGVGARSRRLAGNLGAKEPKLIHGLTFTQDKEDIDSIVDWLKTSIEACRQKVSPIANNPVFSGKLSEFDILHPNFCEVRVLGIQDTVPGAIKLVGDSYREFRSHKHPPTLQNAEWLYRRSIFGLPLKGVQGAERRSSPVWISLVPIGNKFAIVATVFRSRFLPDTVKLNVRPAHGESLRGQRPPSNYDLISNWLDTFVGNKKVPL